MLSPKYFYKIPYGDLIFRSVSWPPLLIWIYFCYKIPLKWIINKKKLDMYGILTLFSMFLPFIMVIYNFVSSQYDSDNNLNTAEILPGWRYCLNTMDITKDSIKKNGLVGYWNYKCGSSQLEMNYNIADDLINRFYYLSSALFIFILIIYNNLSINILKNKNIVKITIFCLIMGIIGMTLVSFNTYYLKSLMWSKMISTFLLMNISAFFLLIIGIFNKILIDK